MLMRYKESPEPTPPGMVPPGWENKIMHATLRIDNANVMASDGCSEGTNFQGFSLSLTAPDEPDPKRKFAALAEGAQVQMPPGKTFSSPSFFIVADPFGVRR